MLTTYHLRSAEGLLGTQFSKVPSYVSYRILLTVVVSGVGRNTKKVSF